MLYVQIQIVIIGFVIRGNKMNTKEMDQFFEDLDGMDPNRLIVVKAEDLQKIKRMLQIWKFKCVEGIKNDI